MMEALRFPWDNDDRRREVAPSAFRPRRGRDRTGRSPAAESRRDANRARRPSPGRSKAVVGNLPAAATRTAGHASRAAARDRVEGRVVQGPQRDRHEPDYLLLMTAVALSAIGILMVFSASGVDSARPENGTIFDAVTTQLGWGLLGGLVLVLAMRLDYRHWRVFSVLGLAVAIVLLILVLMPIKIPPLFEPVTINGATRWLKIAALPQFQPTELAKLAMVVFMAHWMSTRGREVGSFRNGMLPFVLIIGLIAGLVMLEPDLGTTGVLVLTAFTMFFVAGGSLLQLVLLIPVGAAGVAAMLLRSYQMDRIEVFLDPFSEAAGRGFQTVQGLYALALGGISGQGLGTSQTETGLLLPAAENDFIFAVVGQEFGFIGGLVVIGLFMILAWRGVRVAMRAPDTFGALLALGITSWLTFQAFINIGVVVNLLPLTGMPLPFLSDGGTSLVVVLAAVGILLSISRESATRGVDAHEDPHRGRGHRRPHLPRLGRRDPSADPAA